MDLREARSECRRYLNYVETQEKRSVALQKLASDRRAGRCDEREARRRLSDINGPSPVVYDGAKLVEAIKVLLKETAPQIRGSSADEG